MHTKSHPLTHMYIHTHALLALTPKLLQCTTERLAVGQSEVETNKHTDIQTRERGRESAPTREWAAESRLRERQSPFLLLPFIVRQLLYSAVIVDILCFHLELLWFNVSSQPQKQQKLWIHHSTAQRSLHSTKAAAHISSCSLALTTAHCYCPCLCRLFSMRMRDAARCFRSHSWLSCAAAALLLPSSFAALYCILHLNLPSVNLTHTEANSCIYVCI